MRMRPLSENQGVILLVDDTPANLEVLLGYFADSGFDVSVATNGNSALSQASKVQPDLILLDVMMPGLDGFETCRRLKGDQKTKDIPVIFMTALSEIGDKIKGFAAGAVDYVTKPLQYEEVLARVNTHLRLRRLQKQLQEKERETERLLLNTLPTSIVDQLKSGRTIIADHFPAVSVLFADIVNFTEWSAKHSSVEIVKVLNSLFSSFDDLVELHGLEKIKTIGDAYMAAAGAPIPRTDHAHAIAELALGLLDVITRHNQQHQTHYSLRIGIHSGPVVAGVIGTKKFSYDLWGDTVNVASRMESLGLPDRIQVTQDTYKLLSSCYVLEARGEINLKGKGKLKTFFLKNRRENAMPGIRTRT